MSLWFKQGRLEPVQAYLKKNKRGLGADKVKKISVGSYEDVPSNGKADKVSLNGFISRLKFYLLFFWKDLPEVYANNLTRKEKKCS